MALIFLDTSVLLAGLIDFGPQSAPAQQVMHAVAEKTVPQAATAWHCVLEFLSLATRLPAEFRLPAADAVQLLESEIVGRLAIHELPASDRLSFLRSTIADAVSGGRFYDAHIADVARAAGATIVVTDNRRHFLTALRHGLRVETPSEFVAGLRRAK